MRRLLIAGNWKMNGQAADLEFFDIIAQAAADVPHEVLICPPATLLARVSQTLSGSAVRSGGQDCHPETSGAHTGDIAAGMLRDAGADYVILGHSERRADHGEGDALVRAKAEAAIKAGLTPIICVGETRAEREAGQAVEIVVGQLKNSLPADCDASVVIAYEPVWAIGTGLTASLDDIADMHAAIRAALPHPEAMRILYGGSVKPANAEEILSLADVDGALVGGASLKAGDFKSIIHAVAEPVQ